jgi:hypothetical protein
VASLAGSLAGGDLEPNTTMATPISEGGGAGVLAWDGEKAELSMVDAGAVVGRLSRETPGKGATGAGKAPAAATEMGRSP